MTIRITFYGGEIGKEISIPTTSVEGEDWNAVIDEVVNRLSGFKWPDYASPLPEAPSERGGTE